MPRETRFLIRCAFVWLIVSCASAALAVLAPVYGAALRPALLHGITLGWLSQFIFGVAHWLFPTDRKHPPRGDLRRVWWVAGTWNAGLLLRLLAEPRLALGYGDGPTRAAVVLSAALLLLGSAVMAWHLWPRVRGA